MSGVPSVMVEYVDTADMPDGQPLPPYIDDGVVWRVVRRLPDSRTRWRRIRLSSSIYQYVGRKIAAALTNEAATEAPAQSRRRGRPRKYPANESPI
jgi:hypothetical protein